MVPAIILDTDFDTDCDDAGALAVLHALANAGECEILGIVCSVPVPECVGAVRVLNEAFGRPDVPLGAVRVPNYESDPYWEPYQRHRELHGVGTPQTRLYVEVLAPMCSVQDSLVEEAVMLYRRLLANAADDSVTICAIGTLTALAQLLDSGADECSPLSGRELVAAKVRELVCMAGAPLPRGNEGFNWRMDPGSAAKVLRDWPTRISVSPAGREVLTGSRLSAALPDGHPLRVAYEVWLEGPHRSRSSWDQIAVLYAVQGPTGGFDLSEALTITLNPENASYEWKELVGPIRQVVQPQQMVEELAVHIENLMLAACR